MLTIFLYIKVSASQELASLKLSKRYKKNSFLRWMPSKLNINYNKYLKTKICLHIFYIQKISKIISKTV